MYHNFNIFNLERKLIDLAIFAIYMYLPTSLGVGLLLSYKISYFWIIVI